MQVDFYLVDSDARTRVDPDRLLYGLARQMYLKQLKGFMLVQQDRLAAINARLWSIEQTFFLPHACAGKSSRLNDRQPLLLGGSDDWLGDDFRSGLVAGREVGLIQCLNREVRPSLEDFGDAKILKLLVAGDSESLQVARDLWRVWSDKGHVLQTYRQADDGWRSEASL